MTVLAGSIRAAVLGVVQGLTEFLPVSSSGHLALASKFAGVTEHELALTVWLHFGTLLAVCWLYRGELLRLARGDTALLRLVLAGFVPTAVIGLIARPIVERSFDSFVFVGIFFLTTAGALWAGETRLSKLTEPRLTVSLVDALIIGTAQSLALFPGISRSGITIAAALCLGISRPVAAHFSFLISIPVIAGATLVELPELWQNGLYFSPVELLVGLVASFASGLLALHWLLKLVPSRSLIPFALYCAVLGAIVLAVTLAPLG